MVYHSKIQCKYVSSQWYLSDKLIIQYQAFTKDHSKFVIFVNGVNSEQSNFIVSPIIVEVFVELETNECSKSVSIQQL